MRKINILYIITKLELGGAQKQLLGLMRGLDNERFNIFIFTCHQGLLMQEAELNKGFKIIKSRFLERPINPIKDMIALHEMISCIKDNRIDIVHTHSSKAGVLGRLAAKICRAKIIIHTVHGWSFNDFQHKIKRGLFIYLERICAKYCDRIIVVSSSDKEKGLNYNIGKEAQYSLIRYGINYGSSGYKDPVIMQEFGLSESDLIVGAISCFKPQKAVGDFVKAAGLVSRDIKEAKFIIIGEGILRKKIEKLIKKLGLKEKIVLAGWRNDISRILPVFDIFALASLWEGLPISVLEAVSCGCAVVATDTGGVSEVIRNQESGFLVSVRDVEGLAQRIICLLKDKELRNRFSERATGLIGNDYKETVMLNNTQRLYNDILRDKCCL